MLPERFLKKVHIKETGCWEWQGSLTRKGYGQFHVGSRRDGSRRMVRAHIFAYETEIGIIPEGLQLDHLCRNHACVNPAHLEPVTGSVNCRRGLTGANMKLREGAKTHCPKGHPYDSRNTLVRKDGSRECRACARERMMNSTCPRCGQPKQRRGELCRSCYLLSVRRV